ncbi:hypothetical protein T484DRAFT_1785413 [Baffinella frigidus]|nr:hypothetical protein T484DRAFT_1785413 [Cryptophyta sp. CCMP2293]
MRAQKWVLVLTACSSLCAQVPQAWEESDPKYINNQQEVRLRSFSVRLRSFSTMVHKVDAMVAYKADDF